MEMRKMGPDEGPPAPFYGCFLCGSIAPGQVDVGKGADGGTHCICTTCADQIGQQIGMLPSYESAALQERADQQAGRIGELERELGEAVTDARKVELAGRILAAEAEYSAVADEIAANPALVAESKAVATV